MKGPVGPGVVWAWEVEGRRREVRPEAKRSFRKERWFIFQFSTVCEGEKSFS